MKNLINRKIVKKLINHYGGVGTWHNLSLKESNLGYGFFHYSLIGIIKPRRILVIGSKYGFIPAIMALACKDNKRGKVDFVDAGYDQSAEPQDKNHWGGVGFWKKVDYKKHFSILNLQKNIKFYLMTSKEFSKKYIDRKWEYIYIDGDHSYEGVKQDFDLFWPQLNKGGIMGFHDICIDKLDGSIYGVKRLWQELKKQKKYNMIEFSGDCGLGIIQK